MHLVPLAAALLLAFQDPATPPLPKAGDVAPALAFDRVLARDGVAPFAPKGKVVVVDFGTSWCPGCRLSASHWNALAAELAGEPIAFVMVTNEDEKAARRFLDEVELRTPLAV